MKAQVKAMVRADRFGIWATGCGVQTTPVCRVSPLKLLMLLVKSSTK